MGGKLCQIRSLPHPPCYILSYILAELFNMSKGKLFSKESCFRSCQLTADVPTVDRASNRSGSTRAITVNICRAFLRVSHASLLHKRKSNWISGQIFGFILSFLSNRLLRVALDGKSSQEYPIDTGVPRSSIQGSRPTLFLLYINDLPDYTICNITIYADDTTLYFKCGKASDLW